jgi:hypothetical protein
LRLGETGRSTILAVDPYIGCEFQGTARGKPKRDRGKTDGVDVEAHKT